MKKIEDLNYYELLEASPTASGQELHRAYERVRKVYEANSMALYSLFTPEETETMRARIEEAYRTLIYEDSRLQYDALLRARNELPPAPAAVSPRTVHSGSGRAAAYPPQQRVPACAVPQPASGPSAQRQEDAASVSQLIGEFTGPAIKALREQRGETLRAMADITKVGIRYLELIEEEAFPKLPARTYTRGFLLLYAKALGCDPVRMAGDYMKRYDAAMSPPKK